MIIGITGPTGAGKTTALKCLAKMDFAIFDCDAIYHQLLTQSNELNNQLICAFPSAQTNGRIDRKKLGTIVFADSAKLSVLNAISHKAVREEVARLIAELRPGANAAIDAVELISGGLSSVCDYTVAVLAPADVRLKRIMIRDGIDIERAQMRLSAQKADEYYVSNCSHVIWNDCRTQEEFEEKCSTFFVSLQEGIK